MSDSIDAEHPPELRRKRPLSTNPEAVRKRDQRARKKSPMKIVKMELHERVVEVLVDTLERRGHLDERLEREDPDGAFTAALASYLLDVVGPKK